MLNSYHQITFQLTKNISFNKIKSLNNYVLKRNVQLILWYTGKPRVLCPSFQTNRNLILPVELKIYESRKNTQISNKFYFAINISDVAVLP